MTNRSHIRLLVLTLAITVVAGTVGGNRWSSDGIYTGPKGDIAPIKGYNDHP